MLKRRMIIPLIALMLFSLIVSAQELPEGYVQESGDEYSVIYNPLHIIELFGYGASDAYAMSQQDPTDGLLPVFFRGRELGFLYGTIAADPESHKLVITGGGFLSLGYMNADTAEEEQEDEFAFEEEKPKLKFSGKKVEIDASALPKLVLTGVSGVYEQHSYSIVCRDKCRLDALVEPLKVYTNVTGPAVIIKNDYLEDYQQGREMDREWYANISGLSHIEMFAGEHINIFADAAASAEFARIVFSEPGSASILRQRGGYSAYYDSILAGAEIGVLVPADANAYISGPSLQTGAADIMLRRASALTEVLAGSFGSSDVNLKLEKGRLIFLASEADFRQCFSEEHSCVIADRENLRLKPEVSGEELALTITYPAFARLQGPEMLEISRFEDELSRITLAREGANARIIFSKDDIAVEGENWFDLGVSFSAYAYNNELDAYDRIECDAVLKQCRLNGILVSGIEELHAAACSSDSECGEGMVCGCYEEKARGRCRSGGHCIRQANCYELIGFNPSQRHENPINVLVIGDDYPNREMFIEDAKKAIDREGTSYGIFSVSPFKEYKDRFVFYTMPLDITAPEFALEKGDEMAPNPWHAIYFRRQCPAMDQAIVLSRDRFRAFAYAEGVAYFSIPFAPYVPAHEFAHSFAGLADEYHTYDDGKAGNLREPNCLETRDSAINVWKQVFDSAQIPNSREKAESLAVQAEEWNRIEHDKVFKGCGGDCDRRCDAYYRPSFNSIMNYRWRPDDIIEGGDSFNDVSRIWIENMLRQ